MQAEILNSPKMDQGAEHEALRRLLALLDHRPGAFPRTEAAALTGEEWESLIGAARAQRVAPFLYKRLQALGLLETAPPDRRQALHRDYLANAARNMQFQFQLGRIAGALGEEGIPVLALKGVHVAEAVYGNIALRCMGDIDILVPEERIPRAVERIGALGFRPCPGSAADLHVAPLAGPGGVRVEVHRRLAEKDGPVEVPVREVLSRARPFRVGRAEALGMADEDLLVYLGVHAVCHHVLEMGLPQILDVAVLALARGGLDWEAVAARAKAWRCARGVYLALALAERWFGAPVPPAVLRKLVPDARDAAWAEELAGQVCGRFSAVPGLFSNARRCLGKKGLAGKAAFAWRRVFLPPEELADIYAVSPRSPKRFCYYAARAWRLARVHGPGLRRLLRGPADAREEARRRNRLEQWILEA